MSTMTPLLQQAFAEASKLPEAEQDALGSRLLTELETGATQAAGWPSGYFEITFGSITDETFSCSPQDELDQEPVEAADELFRELDVPEAPDANS
jgi:hypothetical protein